MKNKRTKIIIILIIILLIIGTVVAICLINKKDDSSTSGNEVATPLEAEKEDEPTNEAPVSTEIPTVPPTEEEEEPTTEALAQTTTESPAKPESNEAPAQSATTEAPAPSAPTEPAPSAPAAPTTEEPKHEHNWLWVKTKDAWVETVVDKPAWTETKEHPAVYEDVPGYACNYCDTWFATAGEADAHGRSYINVDPYHVAAGYGSAYDHRLVEPAWTETIEHSAETHTVNHPEEGYYKCDCGATK